MPDYQTHEHDVLVIGAGGAGLRAAIEASAAGVSVGLVCKSLLGKAHTVMAEGGIAAALANVDDRDNWQVHFADTMRGGQYVNNWRMAELHAKEAPDRVRELEAWGAVFDRTKDGRILQRNFGGHRYPRLAHVGDRTGLEMIRTLQDHGIHQGIDVHMECTIVTLLKDGDRVVGAFGYERERGRFKLFRAKAVVLATGGIGRAYKITSNSWEYTGDGHALAYDAGAELMDMEFVQFHPTGMIWPPSVRGILVTEGVRGEGGVLRNSEGRRFMFDDIPGELSRADRGQRRRGLALHAGRQVRAAAARAADARPREPLHHARGQGRPRQPARRRVPRHRLDQGAGRRTAPSTSRRSCRACTTSSSSWPTSTSPRSRWKSARRRTTSWAACGSMRDTQMSSVPGLFAAGECAAGINGANRLGGNSLSDIIVFGKRAGEFAAKFAQDQQQRRRSTRGRSTRRRAGRSSRSSAAPQGEGPYQVQYALQEMMQDLVGIVQERARDAARARRPRPVARARAPRRRRRPSRVQPRLARRARSAQPADRLGGDHARRRIERRESRGGHFRDDYPAKDAGFGTFNFIVRKRPRRRDGSLARADPGDARRAEAASSRR